MGFNNFYPYTDFNELNLDWILHTIKELSSKFENIEISIPKDYDTYLNISKINF